MAASLKAERPTQESQRTDKHSRYYYLKTVSALRYVMPLGHSAVLAITQYINTQAAKTNITSEKTQPKRQVKQIYRQDSIILNLD